MKMIKYSLFAVLALQSSIALANMPNNLTRASANAYIAGIEKELHVCAISPEEAPDCYFQAERQYDQFIKTIRSKHGAKVNQSLWQSISLNFKKQGDACKAEQTLSGSTKFFYLHLDCVSNNLHSLAVTAVELHLK